MTEGRQLLNFTDEKRNFLIFFPGVEKAVKYC